MIYPSKPTLTPTQQETFNNFVLIAVEFLATCPHKESLRESLEDFESWFTNPEYGFEYLDHKEILKTAANKLHPDRREIVKFWVIEINGEKNLSKET
jgi:hypothetical protein